MNLLKTFKWIVIITLLLIIIGSVTSILFTKSDDAELVSIMHGFFHFMKIACWILLILTVLGIIGAIIWFLLTRKKKNDDGSESIWSGFSEKFLESIGNFFTSIGKIIVWMAKEAKVLFVLLIIGLSIWLTMEFAPRLAKKWAGVKPPDGVEWSTKQTMIANGWWPDGKKTVWFWKRSSNPKLTYKPAESNLFDILRYKIKREYDLKDSMVQKGYVKTGFNNPGYNSGNSSGVSKYQSNQTVDVDAILQNHPTTKAVNLTIEPPSAGRGTTNWDQGASTNNSSQVNVDAILQNSPITNSINN